MKEKIYTTILFDIDDTLFDFALSEQAALNRTFSEFNIPNGFIEMHDSYRAISKVLWDEVEQGKISLNDLGVERFKRLFLEHQTDSDPIAFGNSYLHYLGLESHLVEGALKVLQKLSHCRLVVITNGFGEVQKSRLENSNLTRFFELVVISEEAGFQKPHRGIFDYAFSKIENAKKSKTIIVGDSLTSDIQGGNNYGIDTVWFNPLSKPNNKGVIPTYEIQNLFEVVDIVNGSYARRKDASE